MSLHRQCLILSALVIIGASNLTSPLILHGEDRLNVLLIAVDDLRPALGCYGDNFAVSPNIDRLASRGTVFSGAYCQQAVCSPSRLSLLTGLRPDTIRVWDLRAHFRETVAEAVTLPQHFKNHGYHTRSIGKVFHGSGRPSKDPPSWSVAPEFDYVRDPTLRYAHPDNLRGSGLKRAAAEAADVDDSTYVDGKVCEAAIAALPDLASQQQPFFLAVGFRKPHLPFCAPKKYWDLYDRKQIPLPAGGGYPQDAPDWATRSWRELEGYTDISADGQLTENKVRELRHGYYACVSYVDALIGRLLDEVSRLKLLGRTVIVLWGDHGFHLGEQGLWTKANNYELATRAPLIIAVPGQANTGKVADGLVEFVDVYPTLADLCELPAPIGLEGISLTRLLSEPKQEWKLAAFSQFPRARTGNRHQSHGDVMGYAVRTDRYRYVEWREWNSEEVVSRELYDHRTDPNEMTNVADRHERTETVQQMSKILRLGWKSALPPEAR